ncbi:two-component system QseEF-associated lipoprotein QseG [Brenneria rubrifaciens]|uniref:Two-component system QseEF-associated lipoprotein QseG n=1 Tax=Brenneria rubrifaciens TaxID=55213 RepID=A0A4V1FA01_9GAMM|nr:two-component system QseEF-associated lipoprotein QseG [Brenneria rubrifaciens]QCR09353.1 two-component system QseEF-associated lipoprotein QseG [Brenneria rubrifaciens]
MNAWFARPCPQRVLSDVSLNRVLKAVVMFFPILLTACNSHVNGNLLSWNAESPSPKERVTNYRIAQCDHLWQVDDPEAMDNALYWLRAMDCAGRLTQVQAREEAQRLEGESWAHAFKQGILLDNSGITQSERRQMLKQINVYRLDFPAALRPLVQTWRDRQTLLLALSDEHLRYKRLQESSDRQLDALRTQQRHLQYQLETTARKLENLTDIERQLSSRKQLSGELPENDVDHRANASGNRSAQKSTAAPTKADDTYTPAAETGNATTKKGPKNP